ncbi:MAG: Lon protease family protein [Polyangiales bacterium]
MKHEGKHEGPAPQASMTADLKSITARSEVPSATIRGALLRDQRRVPAARTGVHHEASELPEFVDGAEDPPDLFRVIPAAPRRAFDLGVLSVDPWFHVFVEAPDDVDVTAAVLARASERLGDRESVLDVVYVHDFDRPSSPRPILLPPGTAIELHRGLADAVAAIITKLPSLDTDSELRASRHQIAKELKSKQRDVVNELEQLAKTLSFGIKTVSGGVQTFPILHGKPVSPEQFSVLDDGTKRALTDAEEKLSLAIEDAADRVRTGARTVEDRGKSIETEAVRRLVEVELASVIERFREIPDANEYLARVAEELVSSVDDLVASQGERRRKTDDDDMTDPEIATRLARFIVNVFVANEPDDNDRFTPQIVYEDNPTLANLFGFLERRVRLGALVSDFTRIRAGALHRASGGVLVLRARDVLGDALAWDRLKRVLRARAVGHEDPIGPVGLYATTLRPRPCPIATKVVLIGPHDLYAQLLDADPDFAALFRVKVEIPAEIDRNSAGVTALDAHLIRIANARGWGPLDRSARARALDYACRLAEDSRKLALYLQPLEEALAFATVIAAERTRTDRASAPPSREPRLDRPPPSIPPPPRPTTGTTMESPGTATRAGQTSMFPEDPAPTVIAADIDAAWRERRDRTAGAEAQLREMVLSGEVLLASEGKRVGVVNGLSVLSAGDVQFGHPMRITSVVSLGHEGVIDVEREASLGGSLHTKGVAILRGFLSGVFGQERPIALRAQIAFEQSYGEVEGDSASSSELYAILSAIADVPIDQSVAVTGSVNQLGEVQAIGGVAAKLEGFFDLCAARGLTGAQGVIIPVSCVPHLVLRDDVADAIEAARFHIYAVDHVTQGIELLTGIPAGTRDAEGRFPADSIFGRVERRLIEIAERMRMAEGVDVSGSGDAELGDDTASSD